MLKSDVSSWYPTIIRERLWEDCPAWAIRRSTERFYRNRSQANTRTRNKHLPLPLLQAPTARQPIVGVAAATLQIRSALSK